VVLFFTFANGPGGYYVGQIYDEIYHPNQLVIDSVKSGTPVIYVAMNYRLGSK
jgi:carboxylesterase type B